MAIGAITLQMQGRFPRVSVWLPVLQAEGTLSSQSKTCLTDGRTLNMSDQTNQAILFETGNEGEVYTLPTSLANILSFHVRFPSCWDGVNVDSPDHKSHV
jgi:Domain of unknown function (DUF1996)